MTAQRRAIAEVMVGDDVHLTAEEVHRRARVALPELSLATVYNTLNDMVASGLLAERRHLPGAARYDPGPQPHHHLVCRHCDRLVDIGPAAVGPVVLDEESGQGFSVDAVEVTFFGSCDDCRARRPAP